MPRRPEIDALRLRARQARWRVRTAAYGGPEWDAATSELQAALGGPGRCPRRGRTQTHPATQTGSARPLATEKAPVAAGLASKT
jgi:hypothetical protein